MTDSATFGMPKPPWSRADGTFFATLFSRESGARYHLIAERLPGNSGWDWTVWRPGYAKETARHGHAPRAVTAMVAAEGAAKNWERGLGCR